MPDWDADSPQLRRNLKQPLRRIRDEARQRRKLRLESLRLWHKEAMPGLRGPVPSMVGKFRGTRGLEAVEVQIVMRVPHPSISKGILDFLDTL